MKSAQSDSYHSHDSKPPASAHISPTHGADASLSYRSPTSQLNILAVEAMLTASARRESGQ